MKGFSGRVYDVVGRIPCGCVATYAAVARAAGVPGSARAVGQVLRRNPFAPQVPCHRVIASDLRVGGFQGETGGCAIRRKLSLLESEGVCFSGGVLEDPARVYGFTERIPGQGARRER